MTSEIEQLIAELRREIADLRAQNKRLQAEDAGFKARLGWIRLAPSVGHKP
jgi:hypothetical protein